MSIDPYFQQVKQNVLLLISQKKYREANELNNKLLKKYPDEDIFLELKEKIEAEVKLENETLIERKLSEIEKSWDQKKLPQIIKTLKDLLKISPGNSKIQQQLKKAQEDYREFVEKIETEFQKQKNTRFTKLLNENIPQLISEIYEMENANPQNSEIKNLATLFKDKIITRKIEEKNELIYSEKYQAIEHFIDSLRTIDEKNPRIIKLVKSIKERQHQSQTEQKNEFIYSGEKQIDTLMKLKKYDKAMKAAEELLKIVPLNKNVLATLEESKNFLFSQTRDQAITQIILESKNSKEEYLKNKEKFLKI